jgi:hypothetical protein
MPKLKVKAMKEAIPYRVEYDSYHKNVQTGNYESTIEMYIGPFVGRIEIDRKSLRSCMNKDVLLKAEKREEDATLQDLKAFAKKTVKNGYFK